MNRIRSRKKSGFTLIEMVVVIAIVVIIAAIAIPQALKAINKSKAATDYANARTYAGQIMTKIANGEIKVGSDKDDDLQVGEGNATQIIKTSGTDGNSEKLIGGDPAVIKLVSDQVWFVTYKKDDSGNDKVIIKIGKTGTGAATPVEIYPTVDSKSEWAKYINIQE